MSTQKSSINKGIIQFPVTYIVFDIIYKNKDLTGESLITRKQILSETLVDQPTIKKCYYLESDGKLLFEKVKTLELEGIVAKQKESTYQIGKRSKNWEKIINWRIDICYIVGYSKTKTAWIIADKINNEIKVAGIVEFGISQTHKNAFYQVANQLKTGENNEYIFIEPILKCKVRGRGRQPRSFNIMTPVFIDFVLT